MFTEVFALSWALWLTCGLGCGVVGGLRWIFSIDAPGMRRTARLFWAVGALLIALGVFDALT